MDPDTLFSKRLNFPNHTSEDTAGSIGYAWTYLCSLHICSWLIPPFLPVILTMDFPLIVPVRKVVPFYPIIYIYVYIYTNIPLFYRDVNGYQPYFGRIPQELPYLLSSLLLQELFTMTL